MVNVRRVRVKSLVSKTLIGGDYVINPYVGCPHKCIYCYASCINRNGKARSEEWGDFLDVKVPATQIDLARIFRKRILFSSMTDAYNPYEKTDITHLFPILSWLVVFSHNNQHRKIDG